MRGLGRLAVLLLPLMLAGAAAPERPLAVDRVEVLRSYPHDRGAFTEGLLYHDGYLYESTGEVGQSSIRKVALESGKVIRRIDVPPPYFGEGIVAWGKQIISLTWQHHIGFRWSLDRFKQLGKFSYPGEGWALTSDGRQIIMSDGTDELRFLDPATLEEKRRLKVTINGKPLRQINELEYVDGEILANIWFSDFIVRIDPALGEVIGVIDLTALRERPGLQDKRNVLNGIAWDAGRRRLFVTGKNWPSLFEIALPRR